MAEATTRTTSAARPAGFVWRYPYGPGVAAEGYDRGRRVVSVGFWPGDRDGTGWGWRVCYRELEPRSAGWFVTQTFPTCDAAVEYVDARLPDVLRLVGAAG